MPKKPEHGEAVNKGTVGEERLRMGKLTDQKGQRSR